ncbi:3D domain-containing protein [Paenibacillus methanolicus]|uniref:3D (Asp-Asp-Asp) domain-containing protein n=1 Tax=Paenibacillus methanolicus TaxID=582686 RepID=A0A5S5BW14_9BACL|nr:3D domain-containing protein [Paenibacillus methanolicus]TYP71381.1 3D (Asp-Asp-Asp) domain-containing protein [Paenibacillus methanolicus]
MLTFKSWKKTAAAAVLGLALLASAGAASAEAASHKATDDDTFWSLSKRYGMSVAELMEANPTVNPLNIYAGLTIAIPDGDSKPQQPVAKAKAKPVMKMMAAELPTNESEPTLTVNGKAVAYTDALQVKASAYTAAASENGQWGAVDYFGNPLKVGTVAVDPNLIPLGTKLFVTGYDYNGLPMGGMFAVASDMGGAIKGNRIDIFVSSSQQQARTFGYQYVHVYVLK